LPPLLVMKKPIRIKTNIDSFFRELLDLLVAFKPIKGLRPRELDILAEVMRQNYLYRNLEATSRFNLIFSTSNRKEMVKKIGISEGVLNNDLSILRKHKVISSDNRLVDYLQIVPDKEFELKIIFVL
jgi:hypothetical protein